MPPGERHSTVSGGADASKSELRSSCAWHQFWSPSDHRVQRKGTARGATIRDSEDWKKAIGLLTDRTLDDKQPAEEALDAARQNPKLSASDREEWLREFGF